MRSQRITLPVCCTRCGSTFQAQSREIARGRGRYCSVACARRGPLTIEQRFWAKVNKDGPVVRSGLTPCWEWTASTDIKGYGQFHPASHQRISTHRFAFEAASTDPIPEGLFVLHICDNPACVRNDALGWYVVNNGLRPRLGHLWIGTHADNMADMAAKGRAATGSLNSMNLYPERRPRGDQHYSRQRPEVLARGERGGRARLTDAKVIEIRRLYAGGTPVRRLARDFDVSQRTIQFIVREQTWRHLLPGAGAPA